MLRRRLRLTTHLSREECLQRISAAIDREPPTYPPPANWKENSKPVVGKATDGLIQLRRRIIGRNPFQACLRARLGQEHGRTVISGKIGLHPIFPIVLSAWSAGIVLTLVFSHSGAPPPSTLEVALNVLGFLIFGIMGLAYLLGLALLYRHLTKDDAAYLTRFLMQTIEAQP